MDREKQIRKRLNSTKPKEMTTLTYVGSDAIQSNKGDVLSDGEDEDDSSNLNSANSLYLVAEDDAHPRLPLVRLPTCAVFHKLTAGRGVPHTFYGFLRQWPALPRVVVRFPSLIEVNLDPNSFGRTVADFPFCEDHEHQPRPC